MTENIGGSSAPYNVTIPSITDNADIQTALRLYHYGSDTSTPTTIPEQSIAGHLTIIENEKIGKVPTPIPDNADLNDYDETGFYTQTSNSFASNGSNYPSKFAGLLEVVNIGNTIFQEYFVVGASESGSGVNAINRAHWRFYFAGQWRPWRTFIETAEFSALGDNRYVQGNGSPTFISNYYTKSQADSKFFTITEANSRQYVSSKAVSGISYTLISGDQSKVLEVTPSGTFTLTIPNSSSVDFPIGTIINIYLTNSEDLIINGGTGVTLRPFSDNQLKLFGEYTEISIRKRASNEWVASGNILEV